MIARPQAELLNMLPVTQVTPLAAKAMEGVGSMRFDAALLEAAKAMRDSAPQAPELTLVPKVQRAFENALSELSQKPLDQLKTLAEKPTAARPEIAAIVGKAAQAAGLNAEETAVLKQLVPLAMPRVLEYKALIQVPGTPAMNATNGGVQPGPQGGTPVREASPADLELSLNAGPQPRTPQRPTPEADPTQASPLAALNQALAAPVLVSTRTDDGSSQNSALKAATVPATAAAQPLAGPSAPAAGPVPAPQAQVPATGRVIQVTTSTPPPAAPAVAPAVPTLTSVNPAPMPSTPATGVKPAAPVTPTVAQAKTATLPVELTVKPSAAPQSSAAPAAPQASASSVAPSAPPAPRTNAVPVPQGLDVQVQDPAKPLPVVPGSELTLKEDGTWLLPTNAQGKAAAMTTPLSVPSPQSAPAVPGQLAAAPQAPSAQPTIPSAPAQAAAATVPEGAAPAPAANPGAGVPAPAAQNVAVAQTVLPLAAAQAPAVPLQPSKAEAGQSPAQSVAKGSVETTEAFQAPAAPAAVQARRTAGDSAFGSLAQFGQDPMKSLAQQTARDYAVRESVFRQVHEALREAPGTDNGRMLIRLKPAELGEVHVDLTMVNGKLSARLVTSQTEVRDAFVRDLHAFKAGLEAQGVIVRDISVAVRAGVSDQQQQQQSQQQAPQDWWRELPAQPQAAIPSLAMNISYAGADALDQRFSALA